MRLSTLCCCLMAANFAPLAAQDPTREIVIAGDEVTNEIHIQFDSLRAILADYFAAQQPDTAAARRAEAALDAEERIADILDAWECGCGGGGSLVNLTSVATSGVAFMLGLIWVEMKWGKKDGADGVDGEDGATGPTGPAGQDGTHTGTDDGQGEGRGES